MNNSIHKDKSLSKRILLYLIVTSFFSLIIIGSLWIGDKIGIYAGEIRALKDSYANTKKEEIKNRVLQLKDYIYWVKANPVYIVPDVITVRLKDFFRIYKHKDICINRKSIQDNGLSELSFYILDKSGQITCTYPADFVPGSNVLMAKSLSNRLLNGNNVKRYGVIPQYSKSGSSDSILNKLIYYNTELVPDHCILSIIGYEDINRILQKYVLDSISKIRFLKDEYFFVNAYEGEALVSNGKANNFPVNIYKTNDTAWIQIFKVQKLSKSEPEGLYYTYMWPKISKHKTTLKTSFFSYLPEWKWIIGTGFYEDDVYELIHARRRLLIAELRNSAFKGIALFSISVLLSYIIILAFSHRLKQNLKVFADFFQKAVHESGFINLSLVHYKEFKGLAELVNTMVSEQRTTRKALDKSEEKFIKAFQNSPDALIITSLSSGLIIEANKVTTRITGYTYDEVIGHTSLELNYWKNVEDRSRFISLLNKYGRIEDFEADLRMKSGAIRNGLFSAEVIRIRDEDYVLSVIRDVTERKLMEQSLKNSEEKYRNLFERNPAPILIYDCKSIKLLAVNEAFINHYGFSNNEITSRLLTDLYPEDEKEEIAKLAYSLSGHANVGEWHHIRKDGSVITIIASSHDLEYLGYKSRIAVITDITERKITEEKLRTRESLLSLIYSHVQDAIYLLGVESDNIFRFLSINRSFLDLTGIQEEQIVDRMVNEIIPEPSLSLVIRNYKQAIDEKRTVQWEETSQYPAGIKTGMVTITPLFDSDGNCLNLVGTVHDITERKKAEEEIHKLNLHLEERIAERTAQLSSINKELESFSYSISHDLRAPLRAITGFSQILARRHRSSLDEEGRQYMDYIVEASARMEQLINDLLNYSRLGRKSINIHPVSLKHIIDTIHNDFKQRLENIGADFIVATDLPNVQGDESLMLQILSNLVDNAIKYRSNEVALVIKIACEKNHKGYNISVSDNGIGIAEEYFDKIFNIFQRLHSEEQYPGTGIGLATVKKAISQLNGTIEVKSIVGKGSTFSLFVPEL
jgi:PAS domain S-box-containing protein